MITFCIGLLILLFGYIFYSQYVVKQFEPSNEETPAITNNDGFDYVPLPKQKNALIQLLNIAGIGPILGAIQGILFGPIAFILIPLGCVFMGGVHDYFAGMLSVKNKGLQITGLIKKYLGQKMFKAFTVIIGILLLLVSSVFVFSSGDLVAERFLHQTNLTFSNPIMDILYITILLYFVIATIFPIDKIIGKYYPFLCALLILGTGFVFIGFFTHGITLQELDIHNLNIHPKHLPLVPMFFMTVSCGLLSGFHSTQSTIISRTIKTEHDGRYIFYGMMCIESVIAMIWAAGAMHVYSNNLVPLGRIGTSSVINIIADNFVPTFLTFIVTIAVIVLPITSGDTALRGLRMIIAEYLNLSQKEVKNRLIIIIPITIVMILIIAWAKMEVKTFGFLWRYFTFFNQLITIPTFLCATVFLYKKNKNFWITLIPAIFFMFVTLSFILNAEMGFNIPLNISEIIATIITIFFIFSSKKIFIK